ncbi:uncharacterized protein LOC142640041 [Castanea sativa]|uniref:uncharacterized protein LOC142640041 n=1 Tax=Castanea sativa TaxID=21020 RepID=UPI003F64C931
MVVSPRDFLGNDARVSVLIDRDQRCWLSEAINNIFLPHEAALIQSIPLSLCECEEKIFWSHSPDGTYSVKSRYRVLMEEELKGEPSALDLTPTRRLWKGVWGLRVPNRVKTVLWRAGSDALPSRANLKKRKIINEDLCPGCNLESETTHHALWLCPALSSVWEVRWTPLPRDWVKVNFDRAIFKEKNLAGLGGVIRNDQGHVMATFTQTIPLPTSVEMVEVLAARSAIGFAKELSLNQVLIEGDSEVIIKALTKGGMDSSSFGHIIKDIS